MIDSTLKLGINEIHKNLNTCDARLITIKRKHDGSLTVTINRSDDKKKKAAVWTCLPIQNATATELHFYLSSYFMESAYISRGKEMPQRVNIAATWKDQIFLMNEEERKRNNQRINIRLAPNEKVILWIKENKYFNQIGETQGYFLLQKNELLMQRLYNYKLMDYLSLGGSAILLINALLVFFVMRRKEYLYFFVYLSAMLLLVLESDLKNKLLWLPYQYLPAATDAWLIGIGLIGYIRFVRSFVSQDAFSKSLFKHSVPIIAWLLIGIACIDYVGYAQTHYFNNAIKGNFALAFEIAFSISLILLFLFCISVYIYILAVCYSLFRKKIQNSGIVLLGNSIVLLTITIIIADEFFLILNFPNVSLIYSLGFFLEGILFSTAISRKAKKLQMEKEAEQQRSILLLESMVKERTIDLEKERDNVREKNREILDSIEYAKRIQTAILPPPRIVKEYLKDSFIVYIPKDIVAGDFYWMEEVEGKTYFAACDCTGHGVPGAMVSVVCNTALNRSLVEFGERLPGKILDRTRELVLDNFSRSDDDVMDGMDTSLACLLPDGKTLLWSGANNSLWIYRYGLKKIEEIKADKQPVGQSDFPRPYTTHEIKLEPNDVIYLFTDGYADQFSGESGRKLTRKKFMTMLTEHAELSMEEQRRQLLDFHHKFRGTEEQIDDICIMGVKIGA
jgi:serine phosphatase RsbU (regulator of sigma subunit)